jgi:carbon-monoxide dehydrogenase small subunit
MTGRLALSFALNGRSVSAEVAPRTNLVDFLRDTLGLTGTHVGCEHGVCGSCHVRVDGRVVRGCLMLAVQVDGASVETIEGVTASGEADVLQQQFVAHNAMQCGFCTPGMIMSALELLQDQPNLDRQAIRDALSGNFCRCTGYQAIVDAISAAAAVTS